MRVNTKVACPGCKELVPLSFKRPGFLDPTIVRSACPGCDSGLLFKFTRPKVKERATVTEIPQREGMLKVQAAVINPSPLLVQLKKDEEEWNKKSVEEQSASEKTV